MKTITMYELIGLIKDGKAPKKIEYKGDIYIFAGDDYSKNDDRKTWLITKYDYFLSTFLNEEVEILPEENEWENIEEINLIGEDIEFYDDNGRHFMHTNKKEREFYIANINKIIKNQKYLKERIDKNVRED